MAIDASIPLQARSVQLADPTELAGRALQIRDLALRGQAAQIEIERANRDAQHSRTLADLYRRSVRPDGTIDSEGLTRGMAEAGLGAQIPGVQKAAVESRRARTEAETADLALTKQRLDIVNGSFASLLAKPDLTHDDVVRTISSWVDAGVLTPDQGAQRVRELPGPNGLRSFLTERALQAMSASERLKAVLPDLQTVDTGGSVQVVDRNPLTRGDAPTSIPKTMTPGERARLEQDATQFIPVEGVGVFVGDKRSGSARPVQAPDGSPLRANPVPTEGERKAATLLSRLRFSQQQLASALEVAPNAAKPNAAAEVVRNVPLIGGDVPANLLTPAQRQQVEAAQLDILDAALTLGTGAAYTREQLLGYQRSYFPQIFDDEATIRDKQARLQNLIRSAEIAAGRAAQQVPGSAPRASQASAQPAAAAPAGAPTATGPNGERIYWDGSAWREVPRG